MEDSTQFCENCKRNISEKNFELHIAHCGRNIKLCDLCNEPISTNMFKAHLDEDHAVVSCSNCEISFEKWMLPQHQNSCERRLVICEFCEAEKFFNEYNEHKDFCGSRTEKCVLCQKYIMLKDKKSHSLVHLPPKQICKENADISQDVKQNSDIRYDSKVKPYVPNKYNQKSYISQNMYDEAMQHSETIETSSEKSEAFMKRYGVCHICKNFISWVDMNIHIPTCASDAGKCSLCGEDVLDEGIKEHMEKYCSKQSKTVSSRRHNSDDKITRKENRRSSYNNDIYEETSDARHSVSDSAFQRSKPKYSENSENTDSRHTVESSVSLNAKPETYCVCPLCNMPVPRAEIKIHINICDADTQKCIHCDEDVPNNDVEKHNCCTDKKNDSAAARSYHDIPIEKASEVFIRFCPYCYQQCSADHYSDHTRNCPKNLFECTLCGDKIPEKDKGMHEGFYCKALIDNYPPSNSCVPTYAESVQNITESRDLGPTSWDDDAICPTCHRRISISDLDKHSVLCKSRIKPCKFCRQDVQVEYEEYHLKVCPVIQDQQSPISSNPKDRSLCKKDVAPKNDHHSKMKICCYCKAMYHSDILLHHKEECQSRYIICNCGRTVKLKNYGKHKCAKNYSVTERSSENKESYERRKPTPMQLIRNFFRMDDTRSYNYEGYSQAPYTFAHHETPIPTAPEYSESELIPCEFCNKKFPFENIIEHTTGCDPELVSRLKKNPLSNERKSNSLAYQHSFFEDGKASSPAITKQSKKKNQEPRTEPGQFLHHSSQDSMPEEKYHLQSNMKSFWGEKCDTENESSELSSDDRKPEYAKSQKNEMSKFVPKEFSSDSDEEIHPYEASINNKNLLHSKKSANKYKEPENGSKSLNEYQSPSQKTTGSDMGLNSECLAQEIYQGKRPKNFKKLKAVETVFKNSKASESFSGEDEDDNRYDYSSVQSSSDKKHSRRVCQKSEEEMDWSENSSHDIPELKNDFAEEETHNETVPVKGQIRRIEDRQKQTDVVHDRKSLKERVHEKELSGIHKVLSEIKLGNNEIMPITQSQARKKRNMSGNRLKFSDASERDKFDYEHSENKSYLDGEGHAELQKNSFEGSEAEYLLHKMNYSNCSEDDFVEINESNHSKFGIIGQDRNIHGDMHSEASLIQREGESPLSVKPDKFISDEIFENKNPDIMINKQSRGTETDNNKSSPSHSAEYYQKLQNFSFRACDFKKLESTKDAINYEENSTEASAKDYVNIYSQVNNLSVEYITVQYGQRDKMKGYVSSLTLGDEKYLSYPELKPTKELAEESAARKAMVSIKKKIEDMSRSEKELESRVPDILQQKQHMESHSKEFEQFSNFCSEAYQTNQKPKTYPESQEHKKDKDIANSNIPKSRKIIESGESDIQQQKPSMGAEIGTNRLLLLSSNNFQMQRDYTSRTQDNRHKDSKNRMNEDGVFTDDGNQGTLTSSKVQKNRDEEILSKKHAFKMEMHIDKPFSASSEYYKKHQHLSSTLSTDKRLDSKKNKVSVDDSGDEEKFSFKTEHEKSRSSKAREEKEPDIDVKTISHQIQTIKSEMDMNKSLYKNYADDYQKHASFTVPEFKGSTLNKYRTDSENDLTEVRSRGKLRFYKTSENNEPNMDLQSSLLLKQNMKSAIDMSSLNKNSGDDYQKHQSSKITQNAELEDKKNKIDSREFLAQGRNRGYENPAFSVEPVTKTPEQSKAKDKSYNEIIDGMKESLENAKLALGRSDGRRRDIDAMVVEHDKRIEAWRKWRHPKSQDSEEEF